MKVSVIIPIYNAEKHLAETLDSILNQTHRDLEAICVLDAPTDGSAEIAAKYARRDKRVKITALGKNAGQAAARNEAAKTASGEWIHFMDADDIISPDFYEKMLECVMQDGHENHGRIDLAACNVYYEQRPRHSVDLGRRPRIVRGRAKWTKTDAFIHGWLWRWLIRRDFWNAHEFAFPNLSIMEDMPVVIEMVHHADGIALRPNAVYYYKDRRGSLVNAPMSEKKRRDWLAGRKMVHDFAGNHRIRRPSRLWYLIKKAIWRQSRHVAQTAS
jgi:CDP-glycerol glycerophosphotransferase